MVDGTTVLAARAAEFFMKSLLFIQADVCNLLLFNAGISKYSNYYLLLLSLQDMKRHVLIVFCLLVCTAVHAQFFDSTSGLMHMPSADMEKEGTFMITNNYLNEPMVNPTGWGYDTFGYGFDITFWKRFEFAYVMTIFDGKRRPNPTPRDMIMFNQDRHFSAKYQLWIEGDWKDWTPSIAVGVCDPVTGSGGKNGGGNYIGSDVTKGNGYYNRMYVVASKHLDPGWGDIGVHLGYQYTLRSDYVYNNVCAGVTWKPRWIQNVFLQDQVMLMAEYDARTPNVGLRASLYRDHFEAQVILQDMKWFSAGLRYKIVLK